MRRASPWLALRLPWLAAPVIWLAAALRFYRLDAQSFWNDEGNSARLAERSLALILEGAAGDVHPPLYYLLLAGWRQLLGDGEFELRALSAFAGILLVAGVVALGRLATRKRFSGAALVAGLLAAVHPALVYYSQEARMYALLGLWAVLSTLLLWRLLPWLGRRAGRRLYGWAIGYLLAVVAGLYTHYFFPVILVVHGVTVGLLLLYRRPETRELPNGFTIVWRWMAIAAAVVALYLPWLPVFMRQTGGREVDGLGAAAFLREAARWLVLGETDGEGLWAVVGVGWLLAAGGAAALWRFRDPSTALRSAQGDGGERRSAPRDGEGRRSAQGDGLLFAGLALHIVLPPLLILLLGATRAAYLKFLMAAAPFVALLAAVGLAGGWHMARRRALAQRWALRVGLTLLAGLMLAGSARALHNLYFDPAFARADYRGIAARIAAEGHGNAGVILNAANQWEVFTYYHRDGAPVYPIPRGQPDAERIAAELEEIAARHERLYALFWGEAERDPQRLVERWLDANAFKAREEWVGDVRFVTYAVPPQPAGEMAVEAGVQFGETITLLGYTLRGAGGGDSTPQAAPGDILQVTLFWQTAEALAQRYKVFLHLRDGEGPVLAQRDAEPVGNLTPTITWQPGQVVVDNHGLLLPADLPAGQYALTLGLYALEDPATRLPVHSAGGAEDGDSFLLGIVTVR